jgi:hypothetical protein
MHHISGHQVEKGKSLILKRLDTSPLRYSHKEGENPYRQPTSATDRTLFGDGYNEYFA